MATGDRVIIGVGSMIRGVDASVNVPVYELERNAGGMVIFDMNGCGVPVVVGGVKGGTKGKIVGEPTKVHRASIQGNRGVGVSGGNDTLLLYPVDLEHYQRMAFINQDHIHIITQ